MIIVDLSFKHANAASTVFLSDFIPKRFFNLKTSLKFKLTFCLIYQQIARNQILKKRQIGSNFKLLFGLAWARNSAFTEHSEKFVFGLSIINIDTFMGMGIFSTLFMYKYKILAFYWFFIKTEWIRKWRENE